MAEMGEDLVIGTLIAPKSYVETAGAFTKAALEAEDGAYDPEMFQYPYVDVLATGNAPYSSANGITTYAASLININSVERAYAANGYVISQYRK